MQTKQTLCGSGVCVCVFGGREAGGGGGVEALKSCTGKGLT